MFTTSVQSYLDDLLHTAPGSLKAFRHNNALRNSRRNHLFTHRYHDWHKAGRRAAICYCL